MYELYTDGSCSPNPGTGGYAGVILKDKKKVAEYSGGSDYATNNVMELTAILEGLKKIPEGESVTILSDSQYALSQISGEWKTRENRELVDEIKEDLKKVSPSFQKVKAHEKEEWNLYADSLALNEVRQRMQQKHVKEEGALGTFIPEEYRDVFTVSRMASGVNKPCKRAILQFKYEIKNPSFRDYKNLKTYGPDVFSKYSGNDLWRIVGNEDVKKLLVTTLPKKQAEYAARWFLRGLSAYDSLRKGLVDLEIEENAKKQLSFDDMFDTAELMS